jgi:hypothetical protein
MEDRRHRLSSTEWLTTGQLVNGLIVCCQIKKVVPAFSD